MLESKIADFLNRWRLVTWFRFTHDRYLCIYTYSDNEHFHVASYALLQWIVNFKYFSVGIEFLWQRDVSSFFDPLFFSSSIMEIWKKIFTNSKKICVVYGAGTIAERTIHKKSLDYEVVILITKTGNVPLDLKSLTMYKSKLCLQMNEVAQNETSAGYPIYFIWTL